MRLAKLLSILDDVAPERLAEEWDHVGLQVGDGHASVGRALLCIDMTPAVLDEAVAGRVQLIVAYHPPLFEPLGQLCAQHWKQGMLMQAVRRGMAVYSPHTALDAVCGGVNDWLCAGLGEGRAAPIKPAARSSRVKQYKLVVFVPVDHARKLRSALAAAGAGQIGNYSECSFNLMGQGTFRGGPGARPAIGRVGRLEKVDEVRVEMVCPGEGLARVVAVLRATHPYETPAFDLYPLEEPPTERHEQVGQGRLLELQRRLSPAALLERVKKRLRARTLEVAAPAGMRKAWRKPVISTVAVCAGAGGALFREVTVPGARVTGEMRHHDVLAEVEAGNLVILAGHTQTERPYLPEYRRRIMAVGGGAGVKWHISRSDRPPGRLV